MLIVYNPTAGRRRVRHLRSVLDRLAAQGARIELAETRHPGHATLLARDAARAGAGLVVAAGGDGTIAEVAAGLEGSASRLGIIPLGTANVLASELSLPRDPAALAMILAAGRAAPLWPGLARGAEGTRLFLQMLGIGFDAQVVHRVSRTVKRRLGRAAYVLQMLRELPRYRFAPISLTVDGARMQAGSIIISKGVLYGGPYRLAPEADSGAPGFTVVLFEQAGIGPALLAGAALPFHLMGRLPGVRRLRGAEISVAGDPAPPAQADGDPAGFAPLHVTAASAPLAVMIDPRR